MQIATFLKDILPALAVASTLILGLGIVALFVAREPARRQRIGELTIGAVLLWLALTILPMRYFGEPMHRFDASAWLDSEAAEVPVSTFSDHDLVSSVDDAVDTITLTGISIERPAKSLSASGLIARRDDESWGQATPMVWQDYAAMAYLIGLLLVSGSCLIGKVALCRSLRQAENAPKWLNDLYSSLVEHRSAQLRVSRRDQRPFSCGVLRPRIAIPSALCERDNADAARHVLLHEQAHVERYDACGHALFNLALPILYAHPLYWLLRWKTQFARELVADAWATERTDKLSYVEDLTKIVRWRASPWLSPLGVMGISRFRSPFCRRMNLLMERDAKFVTTTSRFWMWASLVTALATSVAVATAIGLPAVVNAEDTPTEQAETEEVDPEQVSETKAKAVDLAPMPASEPIECVVEANGVTLRARVDGMIDSTCVEGQVVKKSDVVASLDTTHAELQMRIAERKYRSLSVQADDDVDVRYAVAQEKAAETELEHARRALERAAHSEAKVLRLTSQLEQAKLAVEQARRDRRFHKASHGVSEAEFMAAKQLLEEYTVRSPIDGIVEEVYAADGESVDRGDPICRIQQMDRVRIVAYVPFDKYQPEQLLDRQVVIQGRRGGRNFIVQGKVSSVGSSVDGTRRIKVTVNVVNERTNGGWLLLPGMDASLRFTATKATKADAGSNEETKRIVLGHGLVLSFEDDQRGLALDFAQRAQPEADEEESLAELIASLSVRQKQIKALYDEQARGGEAHLLAAIDCELAIAKARMARAKGDKEEERAQYEAAARAADELVNAQEAAYDIGTITLDRLLRGYRKREETKTWLKRVSK